MSHPPGPLPWALSTPDRLLRKTNKAALATTLQKNVPVAKQLPGSSASVVDGMNIVQRNQCDQVTVGDVATTIFFMKEVRVTELMLFLTSLPTCEIKWLTFGQRLELHSLVPTFASPLSTTDNTCDQACFVSTS